ncbi:MAG: hypothetical protein ACP5PZ_12400, partial [Bacteroidales bacterium]
MNLYDIIDAIKYKIFERIDKHFATNIGVFQLPATKRLFKDIQTEIAKEFKVALILSQKQFKDQIKDGLQITEKTIKDIVENDNLDDFQKAAIKKLDQLAYATERKFFDGKDWHTATFELLFSINKILVEMLLSTQNFSQIQNTKLSEMSSSNQKISYMLIAQFSELKNVIKTLDNINY